MGLGKPGLHEDALLFEPAEGRAPTLRKNARTVCFSIRDSSIEGSQLRTKPETSGRTSSRCILRTLHLPTVSVHSMWTRHRPASLPKMSLDELRAFCV